MFSSAIFFFFFFLAGQVGEPLLPVTVAVTLDTSLPLAEVRVSVEERREIRETPSPQGKLTLRDLPPGDLHLFFNWGDEKLGAVTIREAGLGQFIQVKVRLVEGNAILLDESRVKGVSDDGPSGPVPVGAPAPAPSTPLPKTDTVASTPAASKRCPAPEERVDMEGRVTRLVDNDSFVLEDSRKRAFTVYVGSATRMRPGSAPVKVLSLKVGQRLQVVGAGASGTEGECSVGATEIWLRN